MPPESPKVMLSALFLGWRGNRNDLVLPGIHGRSDAANAAPLARRIGTFKNQHQRTLANKSRIAHQLRQARLILGQLYLVALLGQCPAQIELAEHVLLVDR